MDPTINILFQDTCPGCEIFRMLIAEAHTGAGFPGDRNGQVSRPVYRLEDKIKWFDSDDPRYPEWRTLEYPGLQFRWASAETDEAIECCRLSCICPACCEKELTAILRFQELRCVEVIKLCYTDDISWSDLRLPSSEQRSPKP